MKNTAFVAGILTFISCMLCITVTRATMKPETEYVEVEKPVTVVEYVEVEKPLDESITGVFESLGEFKLTAYCHCSKCCGKSDGITATGAYVTPRRTIAVDPNVIPYGTKVLINGEIYTAEDCGGAIKEKRIDIYFPTHQDALNFGVQYADVSILKEV